MNIAFVDNYGDYYANDRLFDEQSCLIGENLLLPIIALKKELEKRGHVVHTIDLFNGIDDIDVIVFQDIPGSTVSALSIFDFFKQVLKGRLRKDWLKEAVSSMDLSQRLLVIMEPPVINNRSYHIQLHKLFGKIATWNTDLVEKYGYYKNYYPQPIPSTEFGFDYTQRKLCTMICGNKKSTVKNELYSERKKVIEYFEMNNYDFELYGFGWEGAGFNNYKGTTNHKLETLSKYKFCFCYENMCNIRGYITEKIFDCFFSKTVPIYWGAEDVLDFIPKECFIDRRRYNSIEEVVQYIISMNNDEYAAYIASAQVFLQSDRFKHCFSVEAYVDRMVRFILG